MYFFNKNLYKKIRSVSFFCVLFLLLPFYIFASNYQTYPPNFAVTIGEFVYNDDYSPTTDNCYVTVTNPSGSAFITNQLMSTLASGWHYWTFTPTATEGTWPAFIYCGTAGVDLVRQDKTFIISSSISTTTIATSVWNTATSSMVTAGSVGIHINNTLNAPVGDVSASVLGASSSITSQINSNTNNIVTSASSSVVSQIISSITAIPANVWAYSGRTLTSFGTLVADIWNNGTRTLTSGASLTAADVWSYASRVLTGASLDTGSLATLADLQTASSSLTSQINSNTNTQTSGITSAVNANTNSASSSLAAAITNSQANVNATVLAASTSLAANINANTNTQIQSASSSITSQINSNTNTQTSGITSAVNANTNLASSSLGSLVTTASSSIVSQLAASITAIPANVWAYSGRTLTSFGTLVADIWGATTRSLTSLTLSSQSPWTVSTSDFGSITAGSNYLATVTTVYNGTLTDSANIPTVTIYDPSRNVVVNNVVMTRTGVGTYTYSYTTAGNAPAGTWESVFSATVETGKTLPGNDYWTIVTNPAQVIINSISDTSIPSIGANITITNEGLSGYEYQYEWCVVSNPNNACGGGDDVFYASAAKYINPGEDFNTTLTADVPNPGNYYFKTVVYFGTESSGSSRSFTAVADGSGNNGGGGGSGGGGGGGGGGNEAVSVVPSILPNACNGADFNADKKVNSIDFSILLAFWQKTPPFKNPCVDINKDSKVNSVDFSILLYQWNKK